MRRPGDGGGLRSSTEERTKSLSPGVLITFASQPAPKLPETFLWETPMVILAAKLGRMRSVRFGAKAQGPLTTHLASSKRAPSVRFDH